MVALISAYKQLGDAHHEFRCCSTSFHAHAAGVRAGTATVAAQRTAERLEAKLDAFDPESAVSRLNRNGSVRNKHVARLVRRGLEYFDRTDSVFDIHQGRVEHELKAYLRGSSETLPETFDTGTVVINGDYIETDLPLDLNGLAKGYIVEQATSALDGLGRRGFVSGGGDMSPPTGPVAIESPYCDETSLKTLDTDWSVATSGNYRRERDGTDHVYDPTTERIGARHESVTVLARRDCLEADALATTLAALPLADAQSLAENWTGVEALLIHDGVFHRTSGFENHVLDT